MADYIPHESETFAVVISVGTDHHPFERLVQWADRWAATHPHRSVFVQRGTSAESANAPSAEIVAHSELLRLFATSMVVVSHGGPSTVMDSRSSGRLPIVVPRDPTQGEHVDGHQMRFADHLGLHGLARVAASEAEFCQLLDEAMSQPEHFHIADAEVESPSGLIEFGLVVDQLLGVTTPIETDKK